LTYTNAGHNFPLLAHADCSFEYLQHTSGLVLAGMEGIKYKEFETRLGCGDVLFLYTDGVTEAIDVAQNAYGDERLLGVLNELPDRKPAELVKGVTRDLQNFTKNEPQFDDVTMLALRCMSDGLEKLTVDAKIENHDAVTEFIEKMLSSHGCPDKALMEVNIAVDEIFSNIAQYSGAKEASVVCGVRKDRAVIRFEDDGKPYDPLSAKDPDVTLAAGEREAGGLGVFLVKKMMDRVAYEYKDGRNRLLMEKKI
jgi:sigma-B regulation protein RsbU (phosphoserine phosphatase)